VIDSAGRSIDGLSHFEVEETPQIRRGLANGTIISIDVPDDDDSKTASSGSDTNKDASDDAPVAVEKTQKSTRKER
jgi:hypothetical protein